MGGRRRPGRRRRAQAGGASRQRAGREVETYAFAHRGGIDGGHPENSIAAFADALARGCDLESDVRLSLDRIPVLVHDAVRWRPTPVGHRLVAPAALPARRLARYGVPQLPDVYRELGSAFQLSLDVKVKAAALPAVDVARRAGAVGRLWLVHDDLDVLRALRAAATDVRLVHEARVADLRRQGVDQARHLDRLVGLGVDAANTSWADWSPELVATAHRLGVAAFGSLAQTPDELRRAVALGLDGIYSDHLTAMLAAIHDDRLAGHDS